MSPTATACLVCNTLFAAHQPRGDGLCDNPACRRIYDRLPLEHRCLVCGRPLEPREPAWRVCASAECQRIVAAERANARTEPHWQAVAALREEVRGLRDELAAVAGIADANSYPLAVIPRFHAPVTNLPARRQRAFRDHLNRVIGEATASREDDSPSSLEPRRSAALNAVLSRACAQCGGDCCRGGGNEAYLFPAVIRRYLAEHPGSRPRDVLADYLARLPARTYRGSCVFHQPDGCALPRNMRSDTCNRFFCDGLLTFERDPDAQTGRGFVVTMSDGTVVAAAFIDESDVRLVRGSE